MNTIPFGMKAGWWSFGLEQSLPTEWWRSKWNRFLPTTYSLLPYELLPPITVSLDDNFEWLQLQSAKGHGLATHNQPWDEFPKIAQKVGLTLPASFMTFLTIAELRRRIRSNTCCCLTASSISKTNYGYLIPFLADQQGCVYWHIHLNRHGEYFIVASENEYGFLNAAGKPYFDEQIDLKTAEIWYCAPTFNEFIYRFWIENEIWWAFEVDKRPLTVIEQSYFDAVISKLEILRETPGS